MNPWDALRGLRWRRLADLKQLIYRLSPEKPWIQSEAFALHNAVGIALGDLPDPFNPHTQRTGVALMSLLTLRELDDVIAYVERIVAPETGGAS